MVVVNEKFEEITDYDLSKGSLVDVQRVKPDAKPIDDIVKFAWDDEDFETVKMFIPKIIQQPNKLDELESKLTYLAMMTGFLDKLGGIGK